MGITSLLAGIAGKFSSVRLKPVGTLVKRGTSLGTLESGKMIGPVPSPLTGEIVSVNSQLPPSPKLVNESPYGQGWIARLRPSRMNFELAELSSISSISQLLSKKIVEFHVRCFKVFPDHEMVEVGVECGAVLARLSELMLSVAVGTVVHIVSDDPTAYVEMVAWSDRTGNELVEWRREEELYHFLVRKFAR